MKFWDWIRSFPVDEKGTPAKTIWPGLIALTIISTGLISLILSLVGLVNFLIDLL